MEQKKVTKERKSTDLTQKEIAMLRSTSKLSDKEIKLWHTEFLRKYPNGKLDKDTFMKAYKEFNPTSDDAVNNVLLDSIDTNHDGTINFNEFLFFTAVTGRSDNLDERLDTIFDLWDVSDDGLLDQNELAHLISAMYDRARVKDRQGDKNPHKRAKEIITKLDISGDKKLSKDEFIKGCKGDEVIHKLLVPDQ
ncbi:hypothetical protein I4U23_006125 [Adineta vaga]|nr:hypothetical protein I4U23_006125 [Adineta vaga]